MNQNETSSWSSRKVIFRKRKLTLKKKAEELSTLCGVPVCLLCFDADGKIDTWPQDKSKVDDILMEYMSKENLNLPGFLEAKIKKQNQDLDIKNKNLENKKNNKKKSLKKVFETWDSRLDYLPEESLMDILKLLESKATSVEERMQGEKILNKGKGIQIHDDRLSNLRIGIQDHESKSNTSDTDTGNTESESIGSNSGASISELSGKSLKYNYNNVSISMQPLGRQPLEFL